MFIGRIGWETEQFTYLFQAFMMDGVGTRWFELFSSTKIVPTK